MPTFANISAYDGFTKTYFNLTGKITVFYYGQQDYQQGGR